MSKLDKIKPAWHAQVIAEINREAPELIGLDETIKRRRTRLGLMLIWVKETGKADGSIPHGKFGPWLEENLPLIPRRTAGEWITQGQSLMDLLGWQIGEIRHFEIPPHRLLCEASDALAPEDRKHQAELLKAEKKFQVVSQFKQTELVDDATVGKRGRVKGEGGKRALTAAERAVKTAEQANAVTKNMQAEAVFLGVIWSRLPDDDLIAHLHYVQDAHSALIAKWLRTPTHQRDVHELEREFQKIIKL